jgi:hypothetical protein
MIDYLVTVEKCEIETSLGKGVFDVVDDTALDGLLVIREIFFHELPNLLGVLLQ